VVQGEVSKVRCGDTSSARFARNCFGVIDRRIEPAGNTPEVAGLNAVASDDLCLGWSGWTECGQAQIGG
jgi:hypothetical protein